MPDLSKKSDSGVIVYMTLRKAIGVLGTSLPFVLYFGALIIFKTGMQSSLSAYHHTGMGNVFVGMLCAIGVLFYAYRGHTGGDDNDNDNLAGNFAGVFAILVALFPTEPSGGIGIPTTIVGKAHVVFAALFLLTLAYFSLCLFTKTDQRSRTDEEKNIKEKRNQVYTFSGYAIIASIALIAVWGAIKTWSLVSEEVIQAVDAWNPAFWLESFAVFVFGIAWAVKGQALLGDPEEQANSTPEKPPEIKAQSA